MKPKIFITRQLLTLFLSYTIFLSSIILPINNLYADSNSNESSDLDYQQVEERVSQANYEEKYSNNSNKDVSVSTISGGILISFSDPIDIFAEPLKYQSLKPNNDEYQKSSPLHFKEGAFSLTNETSDGRSQYIYRTSTQNLRTVEEFRQRTIAERNNLETTIKQVIQNSSLERNNSSETINNYTNSLQSQLHTFQNLQIAPIEYNSQSQFEVKLDSAQKNIKETLPLIKEEDKFLLDAANNQLSKARTYFSEGNLIQAENALNRTTFFINNAHVFSNDNLQNYANLHEENQETAYRLNRLITMNRHDRIVKNAALATIDLSEELFDQGDNQLASRLSNISANALDCLLGFTPVVGDIKSLIDVVTGKNLITGETLTTEERIITGTFAIASLALGGGVIRSAINASKQLEKLSYYFLKYSIEKVADFTSTLQKSTEIVSSAFKYNIYNPRKIAVYAQIHDTIKTLPDGLQVQRIRAGSSPQKFAVIGRKMEIVNKTKTHFAKNHQTLNTFEVSEEAQKQYRQFVNINKREPTYEENLVSLTYQENKKWAEDLINDDYTVLDLGNPMNEPTASPFYDIEIKTIFNDGIH